jgi:hypothetical protein
MGMDQTVRFAKGPVPTWPSVRELLAGLGYAVQLRMIDNELAFPDEEPSEQWRELRMATAEGMVTARRTADGVVLVVWGNADAGLRQAWNALSWAFAQAGSGTIQNGDETVDAATYRRTAEFPPIMQRRADVDSGANR